MQWMKWDRTNIRQLESFLDVDIDDWGLQEIEGHDKDSFAEVPRDAGKLDNIKLQIPTDRGTIVTYEDDILVLLSGYLYVQEQLWKGVNPKEVTI